MFSLRRTVPLLLGLLAACSAVAESTLPPTQSLSQPLISPTPRLPTATITPTLLPGPLDLPTLTAGPPPDLTPLPTPADAVAADLVALAQRRVAAEQNVALRRVRLVSLTAYTWPDSSLGCPLPDQPYAPAAIPGYRILLAVGSAEYLFHTDFDRVIPCDPATEQLPALDS